MEIFRAEKICNVADNSTRTCGICGKKMKLVRTAVDSDSGGITHMFECGTTEAHLRNGRPSRVWHRSRTALARSRSIP